MATVTNQPSAPVMRSRSRPQTVGWTFMRVSGVLLLFFALGHFLVQHVINDVHDLSLAFVAQRWGSLFWRLYDAFLLGLGLVHGLNGFRVVADDYVHNPGLNKAVRWAIVIVGAVLTIVGVTTIIGGVRFPG